MPAKTGQYDPWGAVTRVRDALTSSSYWTEVSTYDQLGRLAQMTYPTTVDPLRPRFDSTYSQGYLDTIAQNENNVSYARYDLVSVDALGREKTATLGNSLLDAQTVYDKVTQLIKEIKTGACQKFRVRGRWGYLIRLPRAVPETGWQTAPMLRVIRATF